MELGCRARREQGLSVADGRRRGGECPSDGSSRHELDESTGPEPCSEAETPRALAEDEVQFSGTTRNSQVFVRLRIHFDAVAEARELNAIQKEAFRQAVHEKMEAYLDSILEE